MRFFLVAAALIYLGVTGQLTDARVWKALSPVRGLLIVLLIAAPWHIIAALRNPPLFDFTLRRKSGYHHGFLQRYFINEQVAALSGTQRQPARLRYGTQTLLLAVPSSLAVPVERLLSRRHEARFQTCRSRGKDALARIVLGRLHPRVFYFLHYSGVLLDAVLSGAGAAPGIGDG